MMNPFKTIAVLCLLIVSTAWAEDYQPNCPATIDVAQTLMKTPEGWSAGISGGTQSNVKYMLMNIEFSEGNPANLASLKPDSGKKSRGIHTETWVFTPKFADGYWISCEYFQTSMAVIKKLPENIQSCTVTYDTSYSDIVAKTVKCT